MPRLLPFAPLAALLLAACEGAAVAPPAPTVPSAAVPSAAVAPPAAAPSAAVAAPAAPLDASWEKVALADGAVASAATGMPPAFRNGAGEVACPVMGMAIKKAEDAVSYADHAGTRYFFCCDSCEKLFLDEPVKYADGAYLKAHDLDPTAPAACEDPAKMEG